MHATDVLSKFQYYIYAILFLEFILAVFKMFDPEF